jgi:hypothetical protein
MSLLIPKDKAKEAYEDSLLFYTLIFVSILVCCLQITLGFMEDSDSTMTLTISILIYVTQISYLIFSFRSSQYLDVNLYYVNQDENRIRRVVAIYLMLLILLTIDFTKTRDDSIEKLTLACTIINRIIRSTLVAFIFNSQLNVKQKISNIFKTFMPTRRNFEEIELISIEEVNNRETITQRCAHLISFKSEIELICKQLHYELWIVILTMLSLLILSSTAIVVSDFGFILFLMFALMSSLVLIVNSALNISKFNTMIITVEDNLAMEIEMKVGILDWHPQKEIVTSLLLSFVLSFCRFWFNIVG